MEKDIQSKKRGRDILRKIKNFLFSSRKRTGIIFALLILGFIAWQNFGPKKQQTAYQTAQVEKGTLVSSVSESGSVAVANRLSIMTSASGIVSEIDVKNGDSVTTGQKIAVIFLDQAGQQRQAQAWASYLSAKSTLDSANANLYSLQSTMFAKWKTYTDLAQNSTYQNSDGSANTSNRILTPFTIAQDDWLAAEAQYKNQQNTINQAQAALNSASLSYQATALIITAPSGGILSDLTIAPGTQIGSSNSTSTSSTTSNNSSQFIATIKTEGKPQVSVSLSETDAAKVKAEQKATISFDALPNKTFTGRVLGINTMGIVSSGVTTYPATIELDLPDDSILPNMSATANIILKVKNDVLLVPSGAIQTANGQSTVRVWKNGQVATVDVETGDSSDTQTEVTSGLDEGETVIIGSVSLQGATSGSSPFSGGLRFGGGGFGGVRTGGGGR